MILEYKKTLCFICHGCAHSTMYSISVFDIGSAGKFDINCRYKCGDYCICIEQKNDKYKLSIQCPVCGDIHKFFIDKYEFWRKTFTLKCPVSMIGICFAGSAGEAAEIMPEMDNAYEKYDCFNNYSSFLTITDILDSPSFHENKNEDRIVPFKASIDADVLFRELNRMEIDLLENIVQRAEYLNSKGRIRCRCKNKNIQINVNVGVNQDFSIEFHCSDCGHTKVIKTSDEFLSYIKKIRTFTIK